jgi:L-cysteine:1D-myo-inositol 2-amino-2-deoxy-alpha-D-glucopyranoside ligase
MAIRLAVLAHHYREEWDWTEAGLAAAGERLARWRAAVTLAAPGAAPDTAFRRAPAAAAAAASAASAAPVPGASAVPGAAPRPSPSPVSGMEVLDAVRERLADDLDAPGALAAIDRWADAVLADPAGGTTESAGLVRDTADALLGIAL